MFIIIWRCLSHDPVVETDMRGYITQFKTAERAREMAEECIDDAWYCDYKIFEGVEE